MLSTNFSESSLVQRVFCQKTKLLLRHDNVFVLFVSIKYINPPKSTDFAIVYAPTEGLYAELASYRDPKTKELLLEELRKKYKIIVAGPNTLCAILQAYHLGFQTLKVQKHATQIHDDLRNISNSQQPSYFQDGSYHL